MNVSDAIQQRKSIRHFLDTAVSDQTIKTLLTKAARAPSGGNLQPWRIYVINGSTMTRFLKFLPNRTPQAEPGYAIYPPSLKEPYRTSRFKLAEDMYALLKIPRNDKPARLAHLT